MSSMPEGWSTFHPVSLLRSHGMIQNGFSSEALVLVAFMIVIVIKTIIIFGIV